MARLSTGAREGRFRLLPSFVGSLLLRRRNSRNDRTSAGQERRPRVAKLLRRGMVAVLVVTLYLGVFVTLEGNHVIIIRGGQQQQRGGNDYSYGSVMAANQLGQEARQAALHERNFTRIGRAQEREEQRQPQAFLVQDHVLADDDGEPVVQQQNGKRNGSDFKPWRFLMFYMLLRILLRSFSAREHQQSSWWEEHDTTTMPMQQQQPRFREWADRLNAQRVATGHSPLSLESLQLVLRERELHDGQDYDGLLQFHQESGPATEALLHSGGWTEAELEQLPLRVLQAGDNLLLLRRDDDSNHNDGPYFCSVCLEAYVEGDTVRTLVCFHTFHQRCIDDWLSRRAVCPICKHPAAG